MSTCDLRHPFLQVLFEFRETKWRGMGAHGGENRFAILDPDIRIGGDRLVRGTGLLPQFGLETGNQSFAVNRNIHLFAVADDFALVVLQRAGTHAEQVRTLMAGIRRAKGTAAAAKAPSLVEDIRAMLATLPEGLLGVRDRALLLIGFAGAFRRSEVVSLDHPDLAFGSSGLVITLRRSKTDQEGAGRKIGLPYGSDPVTCPVRAALAWLETSGISQGPVFRYINRHGQMQPGRLSDRAVAEVVKRCAVAAGLGRTKFSGHSLRAGFCTAAAIGGATERAIMNQTGHRSTNMVRRYIPDGNLFRENAATRLGL
jgi:integrase